ncbi:hypothetical protein [Methylotuvimicrobium sp.]|uniref:hypothetical protein n=1 Tax=Methylotuvimicrobium sp. TaxID=2822413 RepID=UPI003D654761
MMTIESEKSKPVVSDHQKVDQSKRSLTKVGFTVPVIMTLAGRPVTGFGANCLSQEMSGNASYTGAGSCELGSSPEYWKSPDSSAAGSLITQESQSSATVNATWPGGSGGSTTNKQVTIKKTIKSTSTPYLWTGINIHYGDLIKIDTIIEIIRNNDALSEGTIVTIVSISTNFSDNPLTEGQTLSVGTTTTNGNGGANTEANDCANFSNGVSFSAVFGGGIDEPMRKLLCESTDSIESHAIAAYLNALQNPNYILKPNQVIALYNGVINVPPNYTNLEHFLSATWP